MSRNISRVFLQNCVPNRRDITLKRNVFEHIIEWDTNKINRPMLLTGALGTGKTYLALELAKSFHNSYLYLNPEHDYRLRIALTELSQQENPNFEVFLSGYYKIPSEWLQDFLIIIDDYDYYSSLISLVENIVKHKITFRLLLISTIAPSVDLQNQCIITRVAPLEFDEYLKAIGSEWYTDIIRGHYQTQKKIPDIVHKEMLNLFRDFLRIGGMPAAINEYLQTDNLNNIPTIHKSIYYTYLSEFTRRYNESSALRLQQLYSGIEEQLLKQNKNFRYNQIRKGATHTMYKHELQILIDLHLVNKVERAEVFPNSNNSKNIDIHENQYRLYPNDTGILYTKILSAFPYEITDSTEEEENVEYSDNLYQLLAETYFAQLLDTRKLPKMFWESTSLSKIDFITLYDRCLMPFELKLNNNKRSKSMNIFCNKYSIQQYIRFSTQNFEESTSFISSPIYASFCL